MPRGAWSAGILAASASSSERSAGHAMDGPALIIVSGAAGTGKTTIGQRRAADLRIPYLGKDFIKESLFDSLGVRDRSWSMKLGLATIELLFKLIDSHLGFGQSVIAESNFRTDLDAPRFELIREKHSFTTVEVHCKTDWSGLYPAVDRARELARAAPRPL